MERKFWKMQFPCISVAMEIVQTLEMLPFYQEFPPPILTGINLLGIRELARGADIRFFWCTIIPYFLENSWKNPKFLLQGSSLNTNMKCWGTGRAPNGHKLGYLPSLQKEKKIPGDIWFLAYFQSGKEFSISYKTISVSCSYQILNIWATGNDNLEMWNA